MKRIKTNCPECGKPVKSMSGYCLIHSPLRKKTGFQKGHTINIGRKNPSAAKSAEYARTFLIGKPIWNKGKKLSKEHCEALSVAHIGKESWNKGKAGYMASIDNLHLFSTAKEHNLFHRILFDVKRLCAKIFLMEVYYGYRV